MSVQVELQADFFFHADGDRATTERLIDALMEQLVALTRTDCGIDDPALSADFSISRLTVELIAEAESFDEAVTLADSCVRTAAHAAGWGTQAWGLTKQSQRAELISA